MQWVEVPFLRLVVLGFSAFVVHSGTSDSAELVVMLDGYYEWEWRRMAFGGLPNSSLLRGSDGGLSDYVRLEVSSGFLDGVMRDLESRPRVRYVTPQRRLLPNRSLASSPKGAPFLRNLQGILPQQITTLLKAPALWELGYYGDGVKIAILDTGLPEGHPHFKYVVERSDWTDERTSHDGLGHGTFVAGVIASNKECLGFAPHAQLHIYKVFTTHQVSYTSWFLDAFNYVIMRGIDVVNLSIGGPDFTDRPFMDKVWELTSNGAALVSAIGNDGPLYGTLNNPADQADVIGVGGIDFADQIAKFSSRGITTWELPGGYGRMKPDLVTYGWQVSGSGLHGGCRTLSGTSVASPVVAGALALLISTVEDRSLVNPGMIKQIITASAERLPGPNMVEQGSGKLNLLRAFQYIQQYTPQASLLPSYIDMTDCPYFWPYCTQPLFHSAMPLIFNVTILNGMGALAYLETPTWHPYIDEDGDVLDVSVQYSKEIWPWSGWIAVFVSVNREFQGCPAVGQSVGSKTKRLEQLPGTASGELRLRVTSRNTGVQSSDIVLPLRIKSIFQPARKKRLLWDQYHNLRYPPGYFPRDNLKAKKDPLDWNGDHIHTNFRVLYQQLRSEGYYIDVLGEPFTCFNAREYGALLLVDPEEDMFEKERAKLVRDVEELRLGLVLFAEWHNASVMDGLKFLDDNTGKLWKPESGGCNAAALNRLLEPFHISLCDTVLDGDFSISGRQMHFASGSKVVSSSPETQMLYQHLRDQSADLIAKNKDKSRVEEKASILAISSTGKVAVYGDASCIDSAHQSKDCYWLAKALVEKVTEGPMNSGLARALVPNFHLATCHPANTYGTNFPRFSKVVATVIDGDKGSEKAMKECRVLRPLQPQPMTNWTSPTDLAAAYPQLRLEPTQSRAGAEGRRLLLDRDWEDGEAGSAPLQEDWIPFLRQWLLSGSPLLVAARLSALLAALLLAASKCCSRRKTALLCPRFFRRLKRTLRRSPAPPPSATFG